MWISLSFAGFGKEEEKQGKLGKSGNIQKGRKLTKEKKEKKLLGASKKFPRIYPPTCFLFPKTSHTLTLFH